MLGRPIRNSADSSRSFIPVPNVAVAPRATLRLRLSRPLTTIDTANSFWNVSQLVESHRQASFFLEQRMKNSALNPACAVAIFNAGQVALVIAVHLQSV